VVLGCAAIWFFALEHKKTFSSDSWKRKNDRLLMIDSLLATHDLRSMKRVEVEQLLGPPDQHISSQPKGGGRVWYFIAGPKKETDTADRNLAITYDAGGAVTEVLWNG
jgi:hypothetical protein